MTDTSKSVRRLRERYLSRGFSAVEFAESALAAHLAANPNVELEEVYPATAEQRLFLTKWRMVQQVFATFSGPLDRLALEHAWSLLHDRHGGLRTTFLPGTTLALVHRRVRPELLQVDLRHLNPPEQERHLQAALEADRVRGYGASSVPPLSRILIAQLAEDRHQLLWSYDHVQLDGWSRRLLWRELALAYEATRAGGDAAHVLPPPPPEFTEFVALRQSSPLSAAEDRTWTQRLRGFPDTTLLRPPGRPSPTPTGTAAGALDQAALESWARTYGLSYSTLLFGVWALLLRQECGEDEVAFLYHHPDRPRALPGVERTAGVFYTRCFVRTRPPDEVSLISWLRSLQQDNEQVQEEIHRLPPGELSSRTGRSAFRLGQLPRLHVADYTSAGFDAPWQTVQTDYSVLAEASQEQLRARRGSPRVFLELTVLLGGGGPWGARALAHWTATRMKRLASRALAPLTRALGRAPPRDERTLVTERFDVGAVALYLTWYPGLLPTTRIDTIARRFETLLTQAVRNPELNLGDLLRGATPDEAATSKIGTKVSCPTSHARA